MGLSRTPRLPCLSAGQDPQVHGVPRAGPCLCWQLHPAPQNQHPVPGADRTLPVRALSAPARQAFRHSPGPVYRGYKLESGSCRWGPCTPAAVSSSHGHAVYPQGSQVIRVSFSNFFKEFKSTATWLQFPFICETGTPRKGNMQMRCERVTDGLGEAGSQKAQRGGRPGTAWVEGHTAVAMRVGPG